ncbi:MAG: acetyltransferase [Phycisphaerae bacterium]|nr:acetyltransferase [Phycisphaerae bacterium]
MNAQQMKPAHVPATIVVVGAGGHGRVVLDILRAADSVRVVGFLDSNSAQHGRRMDGLPVLGDLSALPTLRDEQGVTGAIVAIGDNGVRRDFAHRIEAMGFALVNAIHPSANIASNASLGRNVVVAAGALVCAHCQVGDSVILNTGSIVDHESMIGTAAHVCPGARLAGRVTVESGAFIGIGSTVIQSIRVGYEAIVGAGAVVIHDVAPMTTVVGVPARSVQDSPHGEGWADALLPEILRGRLPSIRRPPRIAVSSTDAAAASLDPIVVVR